MGEFSQAKSGLSPLGRVASRCRGVVAGFFRSGFPALGLRCPVCGVLADVDAPGGSGACGDDSGGGLDACAVCRAELPQRTGGFCLRCGLIFPVSSEPATLCLDCRVTPPPWGDAFFYGPYEGRLKALVLRFKFQAQLGLGEVLHGLLRCSLEFRDVSGHDLIVPVPLHPRRLRRRGFNQSLELARGLARGKLEGRYGRLEHQAMVRVRDTPPQHTLPRAARMHNLTGAFLGDPAIFRGRSVLLVDDILTTGATVRAATKELKRCGAPRVDLLVLARA
jgi:ComF family protein